MTTASCGDIAPAAQRGGRRRSFVRQAANAVGKAVLDVLENEEIATRPGLLQRLDPRVKLLTLVLLAVTASLLRSVWLLLALAGLTLLLAAVSRVSIAKFARRVWLSAGLLALLIALPATTQLVTPGAVAVPLGCVSLTGPGLWSAATLVSRVVAAAGFALLMIWTMRWTDLLQALSALRLPRLVVATLAIAEKQIVTLLRTVEQMHLARDSRSVGAGTSAQNRSWVSGRMALVVRRSLKTADDVYDAMLARGFDGSLRAVSRLRIHRPDVLWAVLCVILCAALIAADRVWL